MSKRGLKQSFPQVIKSSKSHDFVLFLFFLNFFVINKDAKYQLKLTVPKKMTFEMFKKMTFEMFKKMTFEMFKEKFSFFR